MSWRLRFELVWKILTGTFRKEKGYYHPRFGITEITLRDRRVRWDGN